jgi:hypothetical protein
MDVPKGVAMKPPRELLISLWRLLIFGIITTSHYFQQRSLSSNFAKDKDLTPDYKFSRRANFSWENVDYFLKEISLGLRGECRISRGNH